MKIQNSVFLWLSFKEIQWFPASIHMSPLLDYAYLEDGFRHFKKKKMLERGNCHLISLGLLWSVTDLT